jgi:biotin carboxyl carrier protein
MMLILEAMKMKNRIFSPINGKIKTVNVKIGDVVPKNELLVEFE